MNDPQNHSNQANGSASVDVLGLVESNPRRSTRILPRGMSSPRNFASLAAALITIVAPSTATAGPPKKVPTATLFVTGLQGGAGSTIGPGGALYVTESHAGRLSRVDPRTGRVTTFASGLPEAIFDIGGPMDVAFIGSTAYVLVTLVGSDIGGADVVGIYRVDGPNKFTIIADIGAYAVGHPPVPAYFIPTGVQYSIEKYRDSFLVADGHHNRVLLVTLDGKISEFIAFGDIVPTGLAVSGNTIYMAEAGPVPHDPEDGKIVSFGPKSAAVTEVASGAPILVDVEFGRGRTLYALSNGDFSGGPDGSPGMPDTGALLKVNADGTLSVVVAGLDRPTSVEFIGNTAYVVTLDGEIWKIDDVSGPPYGP